MENQTSSQRGLESAPNKVTGPLLIIILMEKFHWLHLQACDCHQHNLTYSLFCLNLIVLAFSHMQPSITKRAPPQQKTTSTHQMCNPLENSSHTLLSNERNGFKPKQASVSLYINSLFRQALRFFSFFSSCFWGYRNSLSFIITFPLSVVYNSVNYYIVINN